MQHGYIHSPYKSLAKTREITDHEYETLISLSRSSDCGKLSEEIILFQIFQLPFWIQFIDTFSIRIAMEVVKAVACRIGYGNTQKAENRIFNHVKQGNDIEVALMEQLFGV